MPKAGKKYFAVVVGRAGPNIYNTWDECKEQVSRFPGAIHKSFLSLSQAEDWLAAQVILHPTPKLPPVKSPVKIRASPQPQVVLHEEDISMDQQQEPHNPKPIPQITLSLEQEMVLKQVKRGRSVFFTGSAGTGKSVLLREIIRAVKEMENKIGITASTGIAAVNIGGTTLHSWAGIGLGDQKVASYSGKFLHQPRYREVLDRWRNTDTLVIDEISMIDGSLFDKLELIARQVRKNDHPFGGIQLVLSGDFCQLPPVPQRDQKGQSITPIFAFDAKSWNSCVGPPITLTRVFRQKDQVFVDMLNAMRFGKMDAKAVQAFGALSRPVVYDDGIEPTELFSTRYEVDGANATRLRLLKTETATYSAVEYPGFDSNGQRVNHTQMARLLERLIVPKTIQLKVGAQVMLVKNLIQGELVNGSVGQVVKFSTASDAAKEHTDVAGADKEKRSPPSDWAWPLVRFIGGREMLITPQEFTVNNADGEMEARRDQVPLILAWALSVHKSQGQTLERVKVDLRRTFEKGQAYVALSRATSLEHLQVLNFDVSKVVAHPRVLAWHAGDIKIYDVEELFDSDEEMSKE